MHISGLGIPKLVSHIQNPVGIEIGLNLGATTRHLFDNIPGLTLHGIDPYLQYQDWDGHILTPDERNHTYQFFIQHTKPYNESITHYRMFSDDAANLMKDNFYDFIFIDGLHTYDQVSKDCKNFYSKIKSGGIFSGHDFNAIADVRRAVIEFASSVGATISQTDNDVWYWIKP